MDFTIKNNILLDEIGPELNRLDKIYMGIVLNSI